MANEQTTDAPLSAAVGEQLKEKAHRDEVRAAERQPDDVVAHRVERKKTEERDAARRHADARPGGRARARPGAAAHSTWPVLAGGLALFGVLWLYRRLVRR